MQLGGTLFGLCILQIKPQLERLLNLPAESLMKEIRLTQDLLELFIKYQIPSDLLTYDGTPTVPVQIKLNTVKQYVQNMQDMIQEAKQNEIVNAMQKNLYNVLSAAVEGVEVEYGGSRSVRPGALVPRRPPTTVSPSQAPVQPPEEKCFDEEEMDYDHDHEEEQEQDCPMLPPPMGFSMGAPPPQMSQFYMGAPNRSMPSPMSQPSRRSEYYEEELRAPNPKIADLEKKLEEQKAKLAAQVAKHDKDSAQLTKEFEIAQNRVAQLEEALRVAVLPPEDEAPAPCEEEGIAPTRFDFTKYPGMLDSRFEKFDEDSALRATIINPGATWSKQFQTGLLSPPSSQLLTATEQEQERNKAFDLLDALTRSGALPIKEAALHVVLAATHCFDKSIIDTIVQDNMNPIEKLERSNLIVATTITGKSVEELVNADQLERISARHQPLLIKQ